MIKNNQKTTWIVDAVLFWGLICAFFMDETGLPFHQFLGITVGILSNYHLLAHGRWVKVVFRKLFNKATGRERLYFVIDTLMAAGIMTILTTGIIMSTWLRLDLANYSVWKTVHISSSISTLMICLIKIGMHWKWVVNIARHFNFKHSAAGTPLVKTHIPASSAEMAGRREFLKMMGIVCAASVLAGVKAVDELSDQKASNLSGLTVYEDTSQNQSISINSTQSTNDTALSEPNNTTMEQSSNTDAINNDDMESSVSCNSLCQEACSFPGHCRRYIDSNGNGKCDNGECA